ncbi:MAG TPA: DUF799 domain-containing protein [Solimonas sp.]
MSALRAAACGLFVLLLSGCVTAPPGYDYTAYRQSRPKSILLLPPVNTTTSIQATHGMLSQLTRPLAESGYYVLPVTLVEETFRQNGLNNPTEIAEVSVAKLHEIFGADAALYVRISQYGTVYRVIQSETVVTAEARLVDLRSGALLWNGSASASSAENRGGSQGGLVGLLVEAVVYQIMENVSDASYDVAGMTSARLASAGRPAGMLYGPRSPKYQQDGSPAP